jgi:hypothetical protein
MRRRGDRGWVGVLEWRACSGPVLMGAASEPAGRGRRRADKLGLSRAAERGQGAVVARPDVHIGALGPADLGRRGHQHPAGRTGRSRRDRRAGQQHPRRRWAVDTAKPQVARARFPAWHRGGRWYRPGATADADHRNGWRLDRPSPACSACRAAGAHCHRPGLGAHRLVRRAAGCRHLRAGDFAPRGPGVLRGAATRLRRLAGQLRRLRRPHRSRPGTRLAVPRGNP